MSDQVDRAVSNSVPTEIENQPVEITSAPNPSKSDSKADAQDTTEPSGPRALLCTVMLTAWSVLLVVAFVYAVIVNSNDENSAHGVSYYALCGLIPLLFTIRLNFVPTRYDEVCCLVILTVSAVVIVWSLVAIIFFPSEAEPTRSSSTKWAVLRLEWPMPCVTQVLSNAAAE